MIQILSFLSLFSVAVAMENRALFSLSRRNSEAAQETMLQRAEDIQNGKTTLSYDGDLDYIFALAEALARQEDSISITSKPPATAPVTGSTADVTLKSCTPDVKYASVEEISYLYEIETASEVLAADVQGDLEYAMNGQLANLFLNCGARLRRSLQEDVIGMAAISSLPKDEPSDETCAPTVEAANKCTIVKGNMQVYLAEGANVALVRYKVRSSIRDYLPVANNTVVGLVTARYLGPEIPSLSEANAVDERNTLNTKSNNELSARSIVLFSFAAVAMVSAVGAAMWFRKVHHRGNNYGEYDSTVGPNLSPLSGSGPDMTSLRVDTNEKDLLVDSGSDVASLSPFSSMLPDAYRMEEGASEMDVVSETNESYDDQASSIVISEGWTTESDVDSADVSNVIDSSREVLVLGARKRKEDGGGNLLPPMDKTCGHVDTSDKDLLADTGSDFANSSPFSSMLPYAYRMEHGGSQIDVLLELNESYDDQASSILISEGWTSESEMDSMDLGHGIDSSRESPVLGARKRKEDGGGNLLPPLEMP